MDHVLEINDPSGPYLLNCEPMGYRDKALPARMLRCRSDIWEATRIDEKGTPPIRQVVMFFYMDDDNGLHRLRDKWDMGILEKGFIKKTERDIPRSFGGNIPLDTKYYCPL